MGHIIDQGGVFVNPKKLETIFLWSCPKTLTELRVFLGLIEYYKKFIRGYGLIARPLYDLLKKGTYHWNEMDEQAFCALKKVMTTPLMLPLPNFSEELVIETDVCEDRVGEVLMQTNHPLAFHSKSLGPQYTRLSFCEKEMIVIIVVI